MNKFMQTRTALTHAYASFSALSRVIVLALAFVAGGQIAAQTPSAELTTDGNTLVVTATGDLTTYNITSTSTATVFTAAGATVIKKGHVATNPNWVDAVNA